MVFPILFLLLSASSPALDVEFIGNAAVQLSDGETTLLVDLPYNSGASGYQAYELDGIKPKGRAVSLITHGHADHFVLELFVEKDWEFLGPASLAEDIPEDRVIVLEDEVKVGAFTIHSTRTKHSNIEHYSYLVEWHGRKIYFVGDVEDPTELLRQVGLDVAFITPWMSCYVFDEGATVDAKRSVLYHHFENKREPTCGEPARMERGEVFRLRPVER